MICAVCFGDPGSPLVQGIANGIWVLLAILGMVLLGFGLFFINLIKRGRRQKLC